jgi:hypothetical protein
MMNAKAIVVNAIKFCATLKQQGSSLQTIILFKKLEIRTRIVSLTVFCVQQIVCVFSLTFLGFIYVISNFFSL